MSEITTEQKRQQAKKRRDAVLFRAEAWPKQKNGRPHLIRVVDGHQVSMEKFFIHDVTGIRVDVEIHKDGALVHKDIHVVVNPPTQAVLEGVEGYVDDPILALAQAVYMTWRDHVKGKN